MEGIQWSHSGGGPVPELFAPCLDIERNRASRMQAATTVHMVEMKDMESSRVRHAPVIYCL